jgi:hypothetical protein
VLKNANDGPLGGVVEDPGAPTINAKNVDDGPLGPEGGCLVPIRDLKDVFSTCMGMKDKK